MADLCCQTISHIRQGHLRRNVDSLSRYSSHVQRSEASATHPSLRVICDTRWPILNCSIRSIGSVGSRACARKSTREVNAPLPLSLPVPVPEHFAQIAEVVEPPFTILLFSRSCWRNEGHRKLSVSKMFTSGSKGLWPREST